ncbi:flagellar basal-body rod protein FlgC [Litorimonas taeanensis]|uniref:Flagellar basal-body rod protein FlgC n=1 Tax=Litorimonas taeanensis TaxID=568099 RepID=A0A420WMJ9_9PROT|nr:flagellar basal body rod C-terminal domain-containing protein [Litorimonas taeanensis]RKQ72142.1 flagellar basal-body rod protein FlgC [Litorimonas taeanensis]
MDNSISKSITAAAAGMNVQSFRLRVASENLSNVDTHGYQRKMMTFAQEMDQINNVNRVAVDQVMLDQSAGEQIYDPSHPLADASGFVVSSNVDMMIELADAREAGRSYEANLSTFRQATQMYRSLIDLLRD